MKEIPPPDFETWDAFWAAENKLAAERGPAPFGDGCGRWWCCGTWWASDNWRVHRERMAVASSIVAVDFKSFLAGFVARKPEWFKGTAPQVLEPARPRSVANPIAAEATTKDGKAAAAGEDAEVVEDWDSIEVWESQ